MGVSTSREQLPRLARFPVASSPPAAELYRAPHPGRSPTATDRALKTRRGVSDHATNGAQGTHRVQFATKGAAQGAIMQEHGSQEQLQLKWCSKLFKAWFLHLKAQPLFHVATSRCC